MSAKTKSWSVKIARNMVWARIQIVRREKAVLAAMNLAWEKEKGKIPGILAGAPATRNIRSLATYMSTEELGPLVDRFAAVARREAKAGMIESAELAMALAENGLKDKAPWFDSAFPSVPPSKQTAQEILAMEFMGTDLEAWSETIAPKTAALFQKEMVAGWTKGEGILKISRRVTGKFDLARGSALAMTRTAIMGAANRAQEIAWDAHKEMIKGYVHLSTLDLRTCPVCGRLDGKFYTKRQRRPGLPIHVACRCTYSPVPKSFQEMDLGPAEIPDPLFRASMDGEVPGQMKYPAFFRGLDADKQRAILGSRVRYDRWKAGTWTPEFLKEGAALVGACGALSGVDLFYDPPPEEWTMIDELWRRN